MQGAPRILVVDDEPQVAAPLEEMLRDRGFDVKVALSGSEALAMLDVKDKSFSGLITDINLGQGPNGWDVARRARELGPALAVIYISGAVGQDWQVLGVDNSMLIGKPCRPEQIVAAICALPAGSLGAPALRLI